MYNFMNQLFLCVAYLESYDTLGRCYNQRRCKILIVLRKLLLQTHFYKKTNYIPNSGVSRHATSLRFIDPRVDNPTMFSLRPRLDSAVMMALVFMLLNTPDAMLIRRQLLISFSKLLERNDDKLKGRKSFGLVWEGLPSLGIKTSIVSFNQSPRILLLVKPCQVLEI